MSSLFVFCYVTEQNDIQSLQMTIAVENAKFVASVS